MKGCNTLSIQSRRSLISVTTYDIALRRRSVRLTTSCDFQIRSQTRLRTKQENRELGSVGSPRPHSLHKNLRRLRRLIERSPCRSPPPHRRLETQHRHLFAACLPRSCPLTPQLPFLCRAAERPALLVAGRCSVRRSFRSFPLSTLMLSRNASIRLNTFDQAGSPRRSIFSPFCACWRGSLIRRRCRGRTAPLTSVERFRGPSSRTRRRRRPTRLAPRWRSASFIGDTVACLDRNG
jgi:hypothetical protein